MDKEFDFHGPFGVVEDDEQEVAIEFDDEFDVDYYFCGKENFNEDFEEGFANDDVLRWQHLKMEETRFVLQENDASNRSLNQTNS